MAVTRGPDFVVMGARKSGTTWMHNFADGLADVAMPPVKEMNFFIQGDLRPEGHIPELLDQLVDRWEAWFPNGGIRDFCPPTHTEMDLGDAYEWYRQIFERVRTATATKLCGEVSPLYQGARQSQVDRMAAELPTTQLIYVMRNPVDRIWSDFVMAFVENRGFDLAAAHPADVLDLILERNISGALSSEVVRTWRDAFGDRLHLLFFDQLKEAPEQFARTFCSIIGATPNTANAAITPNPNRGTSVPCPPFVRQELRNLFAPDLRALADELGSSPIDRWLAS